jgi:glutathione S-transferase
MLRLYGFPRSGNTLKVRLALSLLGFPNEEIALSPGAHKEREFLELNPLGQVPVLVDGEVVLRDSQAILVYLAAAYRPGQWDGFDARERGRIAQWLSLSANEIAHGPNLLRRASLFGAAIDRDQAQATTERVLRLIEARLERQDWLEGARLTIADLACAPYLALGAEAGIDLSRFPALSAWLARIGIIPEIAATPHWPLQVQRVPMEPVR